MLALCTGCNLGQAYGTCVELAGSFQLQAGHLAGPLNLAAGTYEVAITAGDDSDPAIGLIDLKLKAGENDTAVAHLEEGGDATATLFTRHLPDQSGSGPAHRPAHGGRAGRRHPGGWDAVINDLSNPDEKVLDLDAGTVEAAVAAAAGSTDPVIGPADVSVAEGKNTIVYAWGSLDDDNLKLAVQTISALHSSPHAVNAGQAGLAAEGGWLSSLFAVLLLGGATALAGRALRVRAAERR